MIDNRTFRSVCSDRHRLHENRLVVRNSAKHHDVFYRTDSRLLFRIRSGVGGADSVFLRMSSLDLDTSSADDGLSSSL